MIDDQDKIHNTEFEGLHSLNKSQSMLNEEIVDLKHIKETLEDSEEKYRAIVENSYNAIYIYQGNKFVYVNDKTFKLSGYGKEEIYEMTIWDLIHPDDRKRIEEYSKERIAGKQVPDEYNARVITKSGDVRDCEFSVRMIHYKNDLAVLGIVKDITERKLAEAALKENEANLSSLINNRNESIWSIDKNHKLIIFNNFFKETYLATYNIELKKGINVLEILTPELVNFWKPKYDKVFAGERVVFEFSSHIGNELYFYEVFLNPIILGGKITGVSALSINITDRKQSEELLRNSESRFRMIHENAPILIDAFDENGRCILWNASCERTFGWSMEEINSNSEPLSLFYPDPEIHKQVIDSIITNPDNKYREWHAHTKMGDVITCMWSNHLLADGTIMSVGYDITERKKIENKLKVSEQRHRLLADNANDVIWTMNLEGGFTYVSPSVEKLRGFTVAEVISQSLNEVITPESLVIASKLLGEVMESVKLGIPFNERLLELEQPCKDGSAIWTEATMSIIYDAEGKFVSILGITRDISERKRNEQVQNILLNIANAVFITDSVGELIGIITNELDTLIDTSNFFVALYDCDTDTFTLPYYKDNFDKFLTFPAAKSITSYVVETGKSLLANLDTLRNLEKSGKIERCGTDSLSWLGVPLKEGGKVMGAMVTQSYTDENAFSEFDKDLLEIISVHINLAINRKKGEKALAESEKHYRTLFNESPIPLWEEDFTEVKKYIDDLKKDGISDFRKYFDDRPEELIKVAGMVKIIDVNNASLILYEANSKKELLESLYLVFAEDSYSAFKEELLAISQGKTNYNSESAINTLRGEPRNIDLTWTVLPGYENSYEKVHLSTVDITESKKMADIILQERNKAQQYLNIAEVILLSVDYLGIVTLINQKGCEILGYAEDEIVGQNWYDKFLPDETKENVKEVSKKIFAGEMESVKYYENEIITKTGDVRLIAWHNAVYNDDKGKIVGSLSSGEDITERKQAEEELVKHREHLEKLVEERTAEVEEKNKKLSDQIRVFVGREIKIKNLEKKIRLMEGK